MIVFDFDVQQAQHKARNYFTDPANQNLPVDELYQEAMTILTNELRERHKKNTWHTIKLIEAYADEVNDHLQDEQGDWDERPCIEAKRALYRMLELDDLLIGSVMEDFANRELIKNELRMREGIVVKDETLDRLFKILPRMRS